MSKTSLPSPQGVSVAKRAGFELFIFSILEEEFRLRGRNYTDPKEILSDDIRHEAEEILSTYNWTRLNKLLFFTVMEDTLNLGAKLEDNRLSSIFDAFTAYPNGPVEAELYEHRNSGFWAVLDLSEGGRLRFKSLSREDFQSRCELIGRITKDYRDRIARCLQQAFGWTSEYYTGALSGMSHELCVWDVHKNSVNQAIIPYGNVSDSLEQLQTGKTLSNGEDLELLLTQYKNIKGLRR